MSSMRFRRWGPIVLAIAMLVSASAAQAAIRPESDVLLPWFEIDLQRDDVGLATSYTLVNASSEPVQVMLTIYTNWGIPVLEVPLDFKAAEARTIALHDWIKHGVVAGHIVAAGEVEDIQKKLTGQPVNGLYYGTFFQEGVAVGFAIARTLDERPDSLWGDTYSVDVLNNYFEAETLVALNHDLKADCQHHGIRFVDEGVLHEGTELIIWSGHALSPSPTPLPMGEKMDIVIYAYDQSGNLVHECHRSLMAVEPLMVCDLGVGVPIGWLEIKSEDPTVILEHLHSTTKASAELHSWCLPADLKLKGPSIDIEKKVDMADADRAPGARLVVGADVEFEYHVTNTGTTVLNDVTVTDDTGLVVTCPKTTLEPGETMVCTAPSIVEPCLHVNTGIASGRSPDGTVVTAQDLAYYTGQYEPAVTLELLVNDDEADQETGPRVVVGSLLEWTFIVTNTGNAPLSDITVARKNGDPAICPKTTLDPGESMTCVGHSLALEGQQHEVATVRAFDPCDVIVVETDPAWYFGHPPEGPGILIKKYVGEDDADEAPGPNINVGTQISWRFIVTNTGQIPLTGIDVTDTLGFTPVCPKTALEPAESMICTATSVALPCDQMNTATAHGTGGTQVVSDTDSAHYRGRTHPSVTLEMRIDGDDADVPPGVRVAAGATLSLTFVVTNTGDVAVKNLAVSDDHDRLATCPKTTIEPAESMTCTMTVTALAGAQELSGEVNGTADCDATVHAEDPAYYYAPPDTPGITVVKMTNGVRALEPPGPKLAIGTTVSWSYIVTNTGNVTLTNVSVTDDRGVAVTCPKTTLEPGESMTCTASGLAEPCQYHNIATASGEPPEGKDVTDSDDSYYFGLHNAAISIDKKMNGIDSPQSPGESYTVGASLTWTYVVTNSGDVALTSVIVTDDHVTVTCPKTALAVGESMTCTASGTAVAGIQSNLGSASGTPPCGDVVSDSDTNYYRGVTPGISLEKLINGFDADDSAHAVVLEAGSAILWSFVVTNIGDVNLNDVAVTDDMVSPISCPKTTLMPGESMTCTASGTATSGSVCNLGTASGTSPQSVTVTATDHACYSTFLGNEGCTPGYWKNHTDSWPPTGYSTSQQVKSVFTQAASYTSGSATLLEALAFGGGTGLEGAAEILLRAAVAALLNSAHPAVDYPRTPASVIGDVNAALATQNRDTLLALAAALDADNNRGCPLN